MRMRAARVLIADDDAGMLRLLTRRLDALDVEVIEAHDALSALVLANEVTPDLIILDIDMPGGSGLSASEMLASEPSLSRVPVIILTGKSDDSTLFRCRSVGARYICKGADAVDQVMSTVGGLLCVGEDESAARPELFVG